MRSWIHCGISVLIRKKLHINEEKYLPLPCEDSARSWSSINKEKSSYQELNLSAASVYLWYTVIAVWAKTCFILKHKIHTFLFSHYVCTQPHLTLCDAMFAPWTTALQDPLFMGLSWQEYWSGLPFLPPGDVRSLGIELSLRQLLHWQVDCLPLSHLGSTFRHCAFLQMTSFHVFNYTSIF